MYRTDFLLTANSQFVGQGTYSLEHEQKDDRPDPADPVVRYYENDTDYDAEKVDETTVRVECDPHDQIRAAIAVSATPGPFWTVQIVRESSRETSPENPRHKVPPDHPDAAAAADRLRRVIANWRDELGARQSREYSKQRRKLRSDLADEYDVVEQIANKYRPTDN